MENDEALQTYTIFRQFAQLVHAVVDLLFANSVVTPGIVVGRVLFARQ